MYLIDEKCINPDTKSDVCLECGGCGRTFQDGHIVGAQACGTCLFYDKPMSECQLKDGDHLETFVRRSDTCINWHDANDC